MRADLLFLSVFVLCICVLYGAQQSAPPLTSSFSSLVDDDGKSFESYFRTLPSVASWGNIETDKHFSILSMSLDHHSDSSWFFKSLHSKGSIGFNRTMLQRGHSHRPYACSVRFFGVGLESNLAGYQTGGTGYLTLTFERPEEKRKVYWHGFDGNETNKVHCYYSTNKDTGSEFLDKPKSLGIAVLCPILLDDEAGLFLHNRGMEQGYYCRPLADVSVKVEVHLRPSHYQDPALLPVPVTESKDSILSTKAEKDKAKEAVKEEIVSEIVTHPGSSRQKKNKAQLMEDKRIHAVCTVQTFMHAFSGPMLYMFIAYYQLMGWRVIVYDRFGMHRAYVKDLLQLPGVDYYPFTVYQLTQPSKYNARYRDSQGTEMKTFYKMEMNWGYKAKKLADTADQDMDKTRTYDYARLEYSHLETLLFIDADELFYCPQAPNSIEGQRLMHQQLHDDFVSRGMEEMRYVRIPYSGLAPDGFQNNASSRANTDFTNHTGECMIAAYDKRSLADMARCWSSGTSFDNFPKSADFAGVCPFHYNHWSCDGMRGGGRDSSKNRCRCKVAFDMQNFFAYVPVLKKCHIMHFNDNKYRFQSRRTKHAYDKGDVTIPCALEPLLSQLPPPKKQ